MSSDIRNSTLYFFAGAVSAPSTGAAESPKEPPPSSPRLLFSKIACGIVASWCWSSYQAYTNSIPVAFIIAPARAVHRPATPITIRQDVKRRRLHPRQTPILSPQLIVPVSFTEISLNSDTPPSRHRQRATQDRGRSRDGGLRTRLTSELSDVMILPNASSTSTAIAGEIAAPTAAPVGCCPNASFAAAA